MVKLFSMFLSSILILLYISVNVDKLRDEMIQNVLYNWDHKCHNLKTMMYWWVGNSSKAQNLVKNIKNSKTFLHE